MKRVIKRRCVGDDEIGRFRHLHPVLRRIYAARGVQRAEELDYSLANLQRYHRLRGLDQAVAELLRLRDDPRPLIIVADFDADGASSCALMWRGLRAMGWRNVQYVVPNRFAFGYGLSPEIVAEAAKRRPAGLLTVDNGISSIEGVAAAKAQGMRVIITDHHLPGPRLPEADAIVNPNQPGDPFPGKHLAGVGVAFYVLLALRAALRSRYGADTGPNLAALADLVALGTVADVVPLDVTNRILVNHGLRRIRQGLGCPGIHALLDVGGRVAAASTVADLGFVVAPRLNAAGRLEDMSLGVECLITDDPARARILACRLHQLNEERKQLEWTMQQQALEYVEAIAPDHAEAGICLFQRNWHQGLIGLVAGRIKERFHRPVVAFAQVSTTELKGSARSISGLNIRDAIAEVAVEAPKVVQRFGGHAAAAGLSIHPERFDDFRETFSAVVKRRLTHEHLTHTLLTDGALSEAEIGLELAQILTDAGPWGQGFPEPLFDNEFEVVERRIVGERHLKMKVKMPGGTRLHDAIAFNALDHYAPQCRDRIHTAYRLEINHFRGRTTPQLRIEHMQPL